MFTLGLLILWIVVWLIYWEFDRKRNLQEVRDLRVRVFELEHDLADTEQRITIVQDGVFSVIKLLNKEEE